MTKENLGELIIQSEDTMYRVARSILSCDADCEDAIQETIVTAFNKIHTLRADKYVKTWFIRILINECYALLRGGKRIVSFESIQEEQAFEQSSDYSDLYGAIQTLPEKIRIVVILYYIEGYRVKEITQILSISESAVKNRLLKARTQLKDLLKEEAQ